jgi:hypothetical protein
VRRIADLVQRGVRVTPRANQAKGEPAEIPAEFFEATSSAPRRV